MRYHHACSHLTNFAQMSPFRVFNETHHPWRSTATDILLAIYRVFVIVPDDGLQDVIALAGPRQ